MGNLTIRIIQVLEIRNRVDVVNYILEFSQGQVKVEDMVDLETFELKEKLVSLINYRNKANKIFAEGESKETRKKVKFNKWIPAFDDDFVNYVYCQKKFWVKNIGR